MNPALSQEFHLFCEQEHPQRHANTDKNPYCVYGTLRLPYHRLESPWVGPINATLERLKFRTVTPSAILTLSASPVSLFFFFCLISGLSSFYLTHEAINLQPPSHTFVIIPNLATRCCATVLQFLKWRTSLFCCCCFYWADFVNSIFGRMVSFILLPVVESVREPGQR